MSPIERAYVQALLPLNILLQEYTPAHWGKDQTGKTATQLWEQTFTYLREDSGQMNIVNTLIEEYKKNDSFRNPILLSTLEDQIEDEHEEERYYFYSETEDRYIPPILDGTHRIYALSLIQEEQGKRINAYVQYGYYDSAEAESLIHDYPDEDEDDDEDDELTVRTYIYHVNTGGHINEDMHDAMFSWLRSFKVNDNYWADADLSSSQGYRLEDGSYVDVTQFVWAFNEAYSDTTLASINEAMEQQIDKMYATENTITNRKRPVKAVTANIYSGTEGDSYKYLMGPHCPHRNVHP